jgi:hypothetical protein
MGVIIPTIFFLLFFILIYNRNLGYSFIISITITSILVVVISELTSDLNAFHFSGLLISWSVIAIIILCIFIIRKCYRKVYTIKNHILYKIKENKIISIGLIALFITLLIKALSILPTIGIR